MKHFCLAVLLLAGTAFAQEDRLLAILKSDADARLIVYGDFNDTRPTPTCKIITGSYNDPGYLTALPDLLRPEPAGRPS